MKTRFFFALPVVAMMAFTTVANAAARFDVEKRVSEVAIRTNNVDVKADVRMDGRMAMETEKRDEGFCFLAMDVREEARMDGRIFI